jgi:UDP-N-acetylglucosamine 1-carboxyvinyltransferase
MPLRRSSYDRESDGKTKRESKTVEKLVIHGGQKLEGEVLISGAKNAALPLMAATILAGDEVHLTNLPDLNDIRTMELLLQQLGAKTTQENQGLTIDTSGLDDFDAPYELVKRMRASVLVLGPLLARCGEAKVSLPGGCAIGSRPIDLHLSGLEAMGAEIDLKQGSIHARAPQLKGAEIYLDFPSVGATENLMMAAVCAKGTTVIENCACEPELIDLANFLNEMGGRVNGAGSDKLVIEGVTELHGGEHRIIPDRIETGTYLLAGAITGGRVTTLNCEHSHLHAVLNKLRQCGVELAVTASGEITVDVEKRPKCVDIVTMPYPGFPTDMQAQFTALLAFGRGTSTIKETIFEDRFMHALELQRLGADIKIDGNSVTITGVDALEGAPVMATDLRASAALVLAGLAANGKTEVRRIYHLDRGYENLEKKLNAIGASVKRQKDEGF